MRDWNGQFTASRMPEPELGRDMIAKAVFRSFLSRSRTESRRLPAGRRHHTIISGTGRTGTTLLVKLFTKLGLDTGFSPDDMFVSAACNAGLEWDLRQGGAPYIVKSPWICDYIEEVVANQSLVIDYAIIPMRTLEASAESRRHVERVTDPALVLPGEVVPGGLWHTSDPTGQEEVLAQQLHKLLTGLAKTEARVILLHYPKLTLDFEYLFDKLQPVLGPGIERNRFLEVCRATVDRSLVHRFADDDR